MPAACRVRVYRARQRSAHFRDGKGEMNRRYSENGMKLDVAPLAHPLRPLRLLLFLTAKKTQSPQRKKRPIFSEFPGVRKI